MAMSRSSYLSYSSGPVPPSLEMSLLISAVSSTSKTASMPLHLLPWELAFLVPKLLVFQNGFFRFCFELQLNLFGILYLLYCIFWEFHTLYSYRILYLLYRIFWESYTLFSSDTLSFILYFQQFLFLNLLICFLDLFLRWNPSSCNPFNQNIPKTLPEAQRTYPGIASIAWIRYKFGHQMVAPSGG